MTDAILQGFTKEVFAESDAGHQLYMLVRPDTDYDDCFEAYDTDNQEFIRVNGWLFTIYED